MVACVIDRFVDEAARLYKVKRKRAIIQARRAQNKSVRNVVEAKKNETVARVCQKRLFRAIFCISARLLMCLLNGSGKTVAEFESQNAHNIHCDICL